MFSLFAAIGSSQALFGLTTGANFLENSHSAFTSGEIVQLRSSAELTEIESKFRGINATLNPASVFPRSLSPYGGKRVWITSVSYYHLGFVLYELKEHDTNQHIVGFWPEQALVDQELSRGNESPIFRLANDVYMIKASGDMISIMDRDGKTYCVLRKSNTESAVDDIRRVASIRCAFSFSGRYNFDGIEVELFADSQAAE